LQKKLKLNNDDDDDYDDDKPLSDNHVPLS